jgi:glycine/D-amino acid oxidase-like deaminating enzyme
MSLSWWLDAPYRPRPPLDADLAADVAVVGGGFTGAAAAAFLAREGQRVVLLEDGVLAGGASGRNAGFLLEGTHSCYRAAVKSHGRETARHLWTLTRENHRLLAELVAEERLDCGYARRGSFTLAPSEQEAEALEKSARLLAQDGFEAEFLDDSDLFRRFPGGGFRAGLFHPANGELHPVRFVRGLAEAAERRGAAIHEQSPVERILPGAVLLRSGRRVEAGAVILATNARLAELSPHFAGRVGPMRGQVFVTEPGPAGLIPAPVYADYGFEYFRQLPDGRLLAGGGRRAALDAERTASPDPSDAVQEAIRRFLEGSFPAAAGLRITHRWGGTMGWSCDELPFIGPVPGSPGLFAAGGYHGHGLAFSLLAARALADLVVRGRTDRPVESFRADREAP